MAAYKILLVEDELAQRNDAIKLLFANYFSIKDQISSTQSGQRSDRKETFGSPGLHGYAPPAQESGKTDKKLKDELSAIPFLDIATNIVDALNSIRDDAENYLLFIVDRDLGTVGEETKVEIEKIWKDFNSKEEVKYAGDLLLEYLCLEKGMVNECKERFRFLTANDRQIKELQDFLEAMHFPKNLIGKKAAEAGGATAGEMIVDKARTDQYPFNELLKKVNNPICFHLMTKHRDVFNALRKNADDLGVDESEHIKNLIKALAYVEDVRLKGQEKPEPPSIGLLRVLLEAWKAKILEKAKKCWNDGYDKYASLKDDSINSNFCRAIDRVKEQKQQSSSNNKNGNNSFHINEITINHLFTPRYKPEKELKGISEGDLLYHRKLKDFHEAYKHYLRLSEMAYAITSQEIHHNDRSRFAGYRLQLVVYGICELLLFYQDEIKAKPIVPEKKDLLRGRILDLLPFLDKDEDGWVKYEALRFFSRYLADFGEISPDSINIELSKDEKKFRMAVENKP